MKPIWDDQEIHDDAATVACDGGVGWFGSLIPMQVYIHTARRKNGAPWIASLPFCWTVVQ